MQKALELNGKKVMGQEVKLDRARSKDSSQEGKKGKRCVHLIKLKILSQNTGKKFDPMSVLTLTFVLQRGMHGRCL